MSENNQYIAFHEGREVEVKPEEIRSAEAVAKNAPTTDTANGATNFVMKDQPESQHMYYSGNEDFTRRDRVREILEESKSGNSAYSFKVEPAGSSADSAGGQNTMNSELDSDAAFRNQDYPAYSENSQEDSSVSNGLNYERKSGSQGNSSGGSGYVTKQFMIICMCIAIIVSTALGAGISMMLGGVNSSKTHSNLSESSESAATGSKLTVGEIVNKNADAVVEIVVESESMGFFGEQQISEGAGSGVIVNESGYIVTNYHVIEGASSVQVTLHNGDSYKAAIVGGDDASDMAVLKINAKDLKVVTIGDSSTVAVGDLAVAIGNPLGQLGGTATSGIISALDRRLTIENRTLTLLQTDAAINPGNSGGGLFNGRGELIGIVESKTSATGVEGLAFAIPINSIKDEINDLIDDGKVSAKPSIGISIYDISEQNAQYYNLDGEGVYIAEVSGDNAKKAGFKKMDRVISINGHEIKDSSDLISRVRECKVGDTVTIVVMRDGQRISIKTKLEESIASK